MESFTVGVISKEGVGSNAGGSPIRGATPGIIDKGVYEGGIEIAVDVEGPPGIDTTE